MMTVLQLANRVCRRLKLRDVYALNADDAQEVLDAINGAVSEFTMLAPAAYRQLKSVRYQLEAPRQITLSVVNGSTTASSLDSSLIGRSIKIDNDPLMNKITGVNILGSPYAGPTGIVQATLYGDVVILGENFSRFAGQPLLYDEGNMIHNLWRVNEEISYLGEAISGIPLRFVVEALGQSAGASPSFLLRMVPIPHKAYSVTATMEVRPKQYTMSQLTTGEVLPIPGEHATTILYPMALYRLITGTLWPKDSDPKGISQDYQRAMDLLSKIPADPGPSFNKALTPHGY
jgi:hypothetical protein